MISCPDHRTDVIVIGAGIAGLSLAAMLSRERQVIVLDREDSPAYHSTGRSAAFFFGSFGGAGVMPLNAASYGYFREGVTRYHDRMIADPTRGALYFGCEGMEPPQEVGLGPFETLSPNEVASLAPRIRLKWRAQGWYDPTAADLDVAHLVQGYLRLMKQNRVVTHFRREVLKLDSDSQYWTVTCRNAVYQAPVVVNAAGAWADHVAGLAGAKAIGIQPMRRTMIALKALPEEICDPAPITIALDGSLYFKQVGQQLWVTPHDEIPSPPCDVQAETIDIARGIARLEELTDWTISSPQRCWAGLRSFAPDRLPVYGFDPKQPGFFWCAGQGGFGIQTAPAAALLCTALIANQPLPPNLSGVDPLRYSPTRFHSRPTPEGHKEFEYGSSL